MGELYNACKFRAALGEALALTHPAALPVAVLVVDTERALHRSIDDQGPIRELEVPVNGHDRVAAQAQVAHHLLSILSSASVLYTSRRSFFHPDPRP